MVDIKQDYVHVKEVIDNTKCLVTDSNGTLYSSVPHRFPKYFLTEVADSFRENGNMYGAGIYLAEFGKALFSGTDIGRFKEAVHNSIVKNVPESTFISKTKKYIENHQLPGVKPFIEGVKNSGDGKKFIIISRHPFAKVAANFFGADDFKSNETIFKNGVFYASYLPIRTAEDKLREGIEKVREHGYTLEKDCLYIGDKDQDIPIGLKSRYFWASPHANKRVRKEADHRISNYLQIAKIIEDINRKRQQETLKVQPSFQSSSFSEIF